MQKEEVQDLVKKYLNDTATIEEQKRLSDWYRSQDIENVDWLAEVNNEERLVKANMLDYIQKHTNPAKSKSVSLRSFRFIVTAAAILLVLGVGLYFYIFRQAQYDNSVLLSLSKHDAEPGHNKATLTLANGEIIDLSDAKTGVVIDSNKLAYNDGTEIGGSAISPRRPNADQDPGLTMNTKLVTLSTPRGGTYKLTLSDGTLVILNAASTIRFPATFATLKERNIELTGEAYFVVKHNARQPFRVTTKGQMVEDIGTEFNINAYADEGSTKTTLIEGSAKVATLSLSKGVLRQAQHDIGLAQHNMGQTQHDNGIILKPNQQSILSNNTLKVSTVDSEEATAWKNGLFIFNEESLESVMRKVSRWYNLEIEYENTEVKRLTFGGRVSRFDKVSEVLHLLEKAGNVHFKIEGQKIKVSH